MKDLKKFEVKKIDIKSIYGGKMQAGTFDSNTVTICHGGGGGSNDGSDEEWDN